MTIYKRLDGASAPKFGDIKPEDDGRARVGYNPAEEARSISRDDWESVIAHENGSSKWAAAELPWNKDTGAYNERSKL